VIAFKTVLAYIGLIGLIPVLALGVVVMCAVPFIFVGGFISGLIDIYVELFMWLKDHHRAWSRRKKS
jgi:hypothetical protein